MLHWSCAACGLGHSFPLFLLVFSVFTYSYVNSSEGDYCFGSVRVCVCADSRAPSFFLSLHVLLVKDIHLISVDRFFQSIFAIQAAAARGGGFSGRERQAFSVRLSSLMERGRDRAPGGKGRNLISARRNCLEGKCPLSHTQHRNDKKNVESHTHSHNPPWWWIFTLSIFLCLF